MINFNLNYEGFEDFLIDKRELDGGTQYIFRFKNGYGASVVKTRYSYGHAHDLWELAVIRFYDGDRWRLNYDTPVTDDVEGCLEDKDVRNLLKRIMEL